MSTPIRAADGGGSLFRAACYQYGTTGRKALEIPTANAEEILAAARLVQSYYQEHSNEGRA